MSTLSITFFGICTHFTNFVDGVLHRVVLADATGVHFGEMRLQTAEGLGPWLAYYLIPHFPFLNPDPREPGDQGVLLAGTRVTVQNAIPGQGLYYDSTYFEIIHSLTEYVTNYEPSNEIVMGHRAACLVDITGGRIFAVDGVPGVSAAKVIIEVETDGPPILSLMPIRPGVFDRTELIFNEPNPSITISNLEIEHIDDAPPYDYLLHYLTDRGGIPPLIRKPTPGMGTAPPSKSREEIGHAMRVIGTTIAGSLKEGERGGRARFPDPTELRVGDDITESCADSRYP